MTSFGLVTLKTVYDTATTGDITLDDDANNYAIILICIRATSSGYGHTCVATPDKWLPQSVIEPNSGKGFNFSIDGTKFTISNIISSAPYLYGIYGLKVKG